MATTLTTSFASLATQYPLTVTDIDGQHVTINQEPQRVVLQDGRDIMSMALLDRDNPFHRLVAWNNLPKKQDTATWDLLKGKWPQSEGILDMGFSDKGDVELESILAKKTRPDDCPTACQTGADGKWCHQQTERAAHSAGVCGL
ncbi:hypothetical protein OS42_11770 [Dickeya oryzae]